MKTGRTQKLKLWYSWLLILKLGVLPTTQTKPDYKIVKRPETIAPDDLFKCCSYNFPNINLKIVSDAF